MSLPTNPLNRKEAYLNAIATGNTVDMPAKPITREEAYLDAIAKNGGGSGGTENYAQLSGKPQINNVELASGNNSLSALGIASASAVNDIKDGQSINSFSAVESALGNKVDTVAGKGLSTNDYSDTEKGKVSANAATISAMVNVNGCCNILPYNEQNTASATVIFIVNNDGSVTGNGTPTSSYPYITLSSFTLKAGTYILDSGVPAQTSLYVNLKDSGGNALANTYEGKKEFTIATDTSVVAYIYLHGLESVSNVTIYPMLYDARLTPTGYVPYAMTNRELTERVDKGSVYVACDGVKTTQQVLSELYSMIDSSKISSKSRLAYVYDNNVYWFVSLSALTSNRFRFDGIVDSDTTTVVVHHVQLSSTVSDCSHIEDNITSGIQSVDKSTTVQPSVYGYRVYY